MKTTAADYRATLLALQDAIVYGKDAALAACIACSKNPAFSGPRRASIYTSGYTERLTRVIAADYPATATALGADFFTHLAEAYIRATPSLHWDLNLYSLGFSSFLRQSGTGIFICDLATLESAIADVFWQPDSPALTPDAAMLTPETLAILRLEPRTASRLLVLEHAVDKTLAAFRNGEGILQAESKRTDLYIVRHENTLQRHRLAATESALLAHLFRGEPIGQALEACVETVPESANELAANLQGWFARWITQGFFRAPAPPPAETD